MWFDNNRDPSPEVRARRCLKIILAALRDAGAGPKPVIGTRTFLINAADADAVGRFHGEVFGETRPASTMVVVAGMLETCWKIEIESEAILDKEGT